MKSKKILISLGLLLFFIPAMCAETEKEITPKDVKGGKKIFDKFISALGGRERLKKISSSHVVLDTIRTLYSPTRQALQRANNWTIFPGKYKSEVITHGKVIYTSVMTIDGEQAWFSGPTDNEFIPLIKDGLENMRYLYQRDLVFLLKNESNYTIALKGIIDFAGKKVICLSFSGLQTFDLYVDPQTYHPVGMLSAGLPKGGAPVKYLESFSEYKTFDGVTIPTKISVTVDGQAYADSIVKDVKFNIEVEPDFFQGK